ncbi:hypothetical protein Tco_0250460, partial [Tanacetum coccineum]
MASMNTRLNIKKLDGNIVQKHGGSKQVGFKQLGPGTGSMQVLQGVEIEVEPQEDLTFEVEPHGNVDHVVASHKVQTQNLIYYHPERDREQHLAWELFGYREDSNEAAFAVATVEKIYAHESLPFNDTVAREIISKWKAGLKDYMDARSDVYMLNNGYKIIWMLDQMLRSGLPRVCWLKKREIYLVWRSSGIRVGHSILSLEGSLSRDYDVKKNDRRRGFVDFNYPMGRSITVI